MTKLDARNRAQRVVLAGRAGLVRRDCALTPLLVLVFRRAQAYGGIGRGGGR